MLAPVGERLTGIDLDPHELQVPFPQLILVRCGRLAGDVLENEERSWHNRQLT